MFINFFTILFRPPLAAEDRFSSTQTGRTSSTDEYFQIRQFDFFSSNEKLTKDNENRLSYEYNFNRGKPKSAAKIRRYQRVFGLNTAIECQTKISIRKLTF